MDHPALRQEWPDEQTAATAEVWEQLRPDLQARIPSCGGGGLCFYSGHGISLKRCRRCGS